MQIAIMGAGFAVLGVAMLLMGTRRQPNSVSQTLLMAAGLSLTVVGIGLWVFEPHAAARYRPVVLFLAGAILLGWAFGRYVSRGASTNLGAKIPGCRDGAVDSLGAGGA